MGSNSGTLSLPTEGTSTQTGTLQHGSSSPVQVSNWQSAARTPAFSMETRSRSAVGEPLLITVLMASGESRMVEGLHSDSRLSELFGMVVQAFGWTACMHSLEVIGKLVIGDRLLDEQAKTLGELGIDGQTPLTFVQTQDLLTIKATNNETLQVVREVACVSRKICTMVEENGPDEEVVLSDCKHSTLRKAMEHCAYHMHTPSEEIQKPLRSTNLRECGVSEWDDDFVNIEQEALFELILVANTLDIKPLLDLSCAKVASMIKGKNTEEIRKQFNIVNDFTPEEEAQVREENRWCEDA